MGGRGCVELNEKDRREFLLGFKNRKKNERREKKKVAREKAKKQLKAEAKERRQESADYIEQLRRARRLASESGFMLQPKVTMAAKPKVIHTDDSAGFYGKSNVKLSISISEQLPI